jgi:hypothetical protein
VGIRWEAFRQLLEPTRPTEAPGGSRVAGYRTTVGEDGGNNYLAPIGIVVSQFYVSSEALGRSRVTALGQLLTSQHLPH